MNVWCRCHESVNLSVDNCSTEWVSNMSLERIWYQPPELYKRYTLSFGYMHRYWGSSATSSCVSSIFVLVLACLHSNKLCCAVLPTAPPHDSWVMKSQKEKGGSSSSFVLRWLQLVLPQLTSMENSPAAQVSSCTWWSLQPDCTSMVPPVLLVMCLKRRAGLQAWQQCHHEVPSSTCSHWSFPGVKNFVKFSCYWILWVMQIPTM